MLPNDINKELEAAAKLLDRKPSSDYIQKWTESLSKPDEHEAGEGFAVVVFRLGEVYFGITATVFSEILEMRKVHSIPQRSLEWLIGLVNYQGRLTLCADMHALLSVNQLDNETPSKYARMLALQDQGQYWIFPVDEVYGIYKCEQNFLELDFEFNLARPYVKGVFQRAGKLVGLLDEELLFYRLRGSLS